MAAVEESDGVVGNPDMSRLYTSRRGRRRLCRGRTRLSRAGFAPAANTGAGRAGQPRPETGNLWPLAAGTSVATQRRVRRTILGNVLLAGLALVIMACSNRELGEPCSGDLTCKEGRCVEGFDADRTEICSVPCDRDDAESCPDGFVCLTHDYVFKSPESYCWPEGGLDDG